jgi:prophage maintenance system killer protein
MGTALAEDISRGELVIYTSPDGLTQTEVRLEDETVWLTQKQLEELFDTDRTSVVKHIQNILESGELEETPTCAFFAQVRQEGGRRVKRQIRHYNLDMILSVGYRVNSKKGTQFRIWANRILKEYLVKGYSLNQKRLREQRQQLLELKQSIQLVERALPDTPGRPDDVKATLKVLSEFARGLELLDDYDHENLEKSGRTKQVAVSMDVDEFMSVIEALRRDFDSPMFGKPKDDSFVSSVRQIYQSFNGQDLYPSVEHKAAMLLYFVVKNHSFVDGNKRIAAALFLYFLERNRLLFGHDGGRIIGDDGLAALTLLIAISRPEEKDTMVCIVLTILNRASVSGRTNHV